MADEVIVSGTDGEEVRYRELSRFPGYRAGSDGSIWSCHMRASGGKWVLGDQWHQLKPRRCANKRPPSKGHYLSVLLREGGKGKPRNFLIHLLILEAFSWPCPVGMEGCHDDGNASNNKLSNLRWDTHSSNVLDAVRQGSKSVGSACYGAKLAEHNIPMIRSLRASGYLIREIADQFGVSRTTIRLILVGKKWKHE